jgi:mRNA (guanine-N7-)-methyltransferase
MRGVARFYHEKHKETRAERDASPLLPVRKFNNFIKSVTIGRCGLENVTDAKVLDLCGGTGGDFPKFRHGPVSKVVLVDNAPDSVAEAELRYRNASKHNSFSAEFVCANAFSLTDLMKQLSPEIHPSSSFDLVNCQFALHYAFQSVETAAAAFEVIAYYLKPRGRCIATVPNAQFILENLTTEQGRRVLFRPPFFEIVFPDDDENNTREGDYTFSMGNCVQEVPEYLVYESVLREAAEKHGLQLTLWCSFQQFFQQSFEANRELAFQFGCMVETINGPMPHPEAWSCAELYLVVVLEKK